MDSPLLSRTTQLHQLAQVTRLVRVMLWVAMVVIGVVVAISLYLGWVVTALMLLAAGTLAGLGLTAGRHGHNKTAAGLLCASLYLAIMPAAYHGLGTYDEAVFAFPALILVATFALPHGYGTWSASAVSVASVFVLTIAQAVGWIHPPVPLTWARPVFASVIFLAVGGVSAAVHEVWEEDLIALVESYEATLRGWAALLEAKGGDVVGHSQRVTDLAEALGHKLGCTASELEPLRRGAYLHDIGKMAIPDGILLKPGPLDEEERWLVERHPEVAKEILSSIAFLEPAIPVPYCHHERWDGLGYPQGLKGRHIPRIARIFTVADHWDAMISDRPYRMAWPRETVIEYMRENSGRIYDPEVVDALFELLDEGKVPEAPHAPAARLLEEREPAPAPAGRAS